MSKDNEHFEFTGLMLFDALVANADQTRHIYTPEDFNLPDPDGRDFPSTWEEQNPRVAAEFRRQHGISTVRLAGLMQQKEL